MKPKVVAIIQARMASSRLPSKVLLPLGPDNKSVLWWMATRAGLAKLVDEVYIATTADLLNDEIDLCDNIVNGIYRYHGQEDDVIGRVLSCAEYANADIIVEISADCPLVDPRHINYLLETLLESKYEYVSNCVPERSWPDGLDVQVYWTKVLKRCQKIIMPQHHVGWNIGIRAGTFDCCNCIAPPSMHFPQWGLTLDEESDYELLRVLFNRFGADSNFDVEDVIKYLIQNPKLLEINKKVRRKDPEKEK